jgi:hypothetical protein
MQAPVDPLFPNQYLFKVIPDHMIEHYRELYSKHYDINISKERATEECYALLNLFKTIMKFKASFYDEIDTNLPGNIVDEN